MRIIPGILFYEVAFIAKCRPTGATVLHNAHQQPGLLSRDASRKPDVRLDRQEQTPRSVRFAPLARSPGIGPGPPLARNARYARDVGTSRRAASTSRASRSYASGQSGGGVDRRGRSDSKILVMPDTLYDSNGHFTAEAQAAMTVFRDSALKAAPHRSMRDISKEWNKVRLATDTRSRTCKTYTIRLQDRNG